MGYITWVDFGVLGWFLALCIGSSLAFRSGRNWGTLCMLAGSGLGVLGVPLWVGARVLHIQAMFSSSGRRVEELDERYEVLSLAASISSFGGILLFAVGFIGFSIRLRAVALRTAELEQLGRQLQVRMEGEC